MSDEEKQAGEDPADEQSDPHEPDEPQEQEPASDEAEPKPESHEEADGGQEATEGAEEAEEGEGQASEEEREQEREQEEEKQEEETKEELEEDAAAGEDEEEEGAEEKATEEEEEEEQEEPEEEATALYDGLDSGLSWFGEEALVPPVPTGYAAPGEEAVVSPAAPVEPAVPERRLSVRERLEARRAEAEATKQWYKKVPIPVWLCMPALIFIIGWILFVARPWQHVPGPREACDKALLKAPIAGDIEQALRDMAVVTMSPPDSWQPLPDHILRTDGVRSARLTLAQPQATEGQPDFEFACDVAIADFDPYSEYRVKVELDPAWAIELRGNRREQRAGREAAKVDYYFYYYRQGQQVVGSPHQQTTIKKLHWYKLRIVVDGGLAYYYINGKRVGDAVLPAYQTPQPILIQVTNAQVLVRNPRVKTAD